ncbi:segregation/condensation protein A [Streptomyces cinnamoneus]|uniref:Segregation and condensation protein A n=1 Tax=Streptomyces cinnamoneus TaxID=53446 RepID=A0A2G1XB06_STRCJ|nr:segregation/condensation protein A [Streptomyces cinnamoneus]PHQ48427.1 segregation/condensation protein A [Streptomyces cinnamoneus]PPT12577.1 segregation/condensation protein A [Streptomyces cinnamoneus]
MPPAASSPARRPLGRGPASRPAVPPPAGDDGARGGDPGRREDGGTARATAAGPEADGTAPAADTRPEPPAAGTAEQAAPSEPAALSEAADRAEPAGTPDTPEPAEAPEPADTTGGADAPDGAGTPDDGRFTIHLENFEGPFDLLLQLIAKHKLDVTEVALHKVTDEFMAHIRAMGPEFDLDQTTEFLVVAATLLDLKAARLLPAAEVEDEGDLALLEARDLLFARLLQYRAYKRIAEIFSGRLEDEAHRHPRTVGLEPHHAELLPEVVLGIGAERLAELAARAMRPRPAPQVYVDHIHAPLVSVREQAEVVVARLREAGEATFGRLTADASDTLTVVARFLALLELYRERVVVLDQDEALGALTVRWTGAADASPVVTDEFDREPETEPEEATA